LFVGSQKLIQYKPLEEALDPPTNNLQHLRVIRFQKLITLVTQMHLKLGLKMVLGWLLAFEDNKCHKRPKEESRPLESYD
jgi:hypothetical protein